MKRRRRPPRPATAPATSAAPTGVLALAWVCVAGCAWAGQPADAAATPEAGRPDRPLDTAVLDSAIADAPGDIVAPDGGPTSEPCAARRGGALVSFRACSQSFALWITEPAFLEEAVRRRGAGRGRIPVFTLRDGRDCDPQWSWHVDPERVTFADLTIELCDGCPAHVESSKDSWIHVVETFCPWSAEVTDVRDQR